MMLARNNPLMHWLCICGQPNQAVREECLACHKDKPTNPEYIKEFPKFTNNELCLI